MSVNIAKLQVSNERFDMPSPSVGVKDPSFQSGRPATDDETVLVNDLVARLVPPPCGKQLYVVTDTYLVT
jgi:hypothetical protein